MAAANPASRGSRKSKDLRSVKQSMTAAQLNRLEDYQPFTFEMVNSNGVPYSCSIPCGCCKPSCTCSFGCGNTLEDTLLITLLLFSVWTMILGFTVLLLHGALESDEGTHVLLWTYFWFFLVFVTITIASIHTTGIINAKEETQRADMRERLNNMRARVAEMEKEGAVGGAAAPASVAPVAQSTSNPLVGAGESKA